LSATAVTGGKQRLSTDTHIIALDRFVEATRDSGYRGTSSAVSELVDNAIQANATTICIIVEQDPDDHSGALRVQVLDDGCGMNPETLVQSLRFGGTTRFNDRQGLGRYGMGLPNSSLSQARRLEVVSWRTPSHAHMSYLDVDEIASGRVINVPSPARVSIPKLAAERKFRSGTLVSWLRCDRLDFRRPSVLAGKLAKFLGRVFRHYLWSDLAILVNGERVRGLDPLFLNPKSAIKGACQFGEPLEYDIEVPLPDGRAVVSGQVTVTFSELPITEWHRLSNEEKRDLGITKGAGMSVVRAGRELDYGWFFFGDKRKENYDDWWRCELKFDSGLDEVFGITHTKQQIRPTQDLLQAIVPDIEAMAKTLNRRVRQSHERLHFSSAARPAESIAAIKERLLPAVKQSKRGNKIDVSKFLKKHPELVNADRQGAKSHPKYSLVIDKVSSDRFFQSVKHGGQIIVVLNPDHPFYRRIYAPLLDSSDSLMSKLKQQVDLLLLAAARSEWSQPTSDKFLSTWSDILSTFLQ
jgi:hypothetical protein